MNGLTFEVVDLTNELGRKTWHEAMEYVNNMDGNYRLPTIVELVRIYDSIPREDRVSMSYWSSTNDMDEAMLLQMYWGTTGLYDKTFKMYVKAIRDIGA